MPTQPKPGDTVEVKTKTATETGILMPTSREDVIIIKLDNGYNMGFPKKGAKLTLKSAAKPTKQTKTKLSKNKNLPTISILHTGGTIASKVDYRTGGVVSSYDPADLINMFPELSEIANIESELIAQMWSDDLRFPHFKKIAQKIQEHYKKYKPQGIIIGMGTDNLAVASAALSFIVEKTPIPIIFVGSQRSSDRGSSDAAMNLVCAAEFITKTDFAGVAICMHGSSNDDVCNILPGTKTYKLHSSRRDAFQPINTTPIATVDYATKSITYPNSTYPKADKTLEIKPDMEEKVGFLKISINMFPEQFKAFKGFKGLVLEGTGLGHAPIHVPTPECKIHEKIKAELESLQKSGCTIILTTQCLFGAVNMNIYDKGRDLQGLGVIPGKDMLANTAYVKLAWLLSNYPANEVPTLLAQNLRGEINEKIAYEPNFRGEK